MKANLPMGTKSIINVKALIRHKEQIKYHERMSSRMVQSAAVLERNEFIGWEMYVPQTGLTGMRLFGTETVSEEDLSWISEFTAESNDSIICYDWNDELTELYELSISFERINKKPRIGFGCDVIDRSDKRPPVLPTGFSTQFAEMIKAFQGTGALFRIVLGSANNDEIDACISDFNKVSNISLSEANQYLGHPVRAVVHILLPSKPSLRLKTVLEEAVQGLQIIYIGNIKNQTTLEKWDNPLEYAHVLPDYAARIMVMEPIVSEAMVGIELVDERVKPIPACNYENQSDKAVCIGEAIATTGIKCSISIGEIDLKRHYQIVGQTGTGKSTLLANFILSAISQNYGLTFFDPHGSTIDVILKSVPKEYANRIRVVRIGDTDNPVPLNIWNSGNPYKEERTINDLCELFSDIFDPHRDGVVGPRYERWLSTFAKASLAIFGKKASFESIALLSQSQDNMLKVYKAIKEHYPDIAETIKEEYGKDKSNDFQSTLNWYLCKFQRLTSVEQLRKTLGAGANAVDFKTNIDTNVVTLVDLASPSIGTHAARIVGTLMLMQLWNAAMTREKRDRTHMVVIDEASLFQTNPIPRMLAESRKFGLSMVLCHQHAGQLSPEIKDALEANSANFSAFRLSPRDALTAAIRFDDETMQNMLARLDAFNAITTISVNGKQTSPFTLQINKPQEQENGSAIAAEIEKRSVETLVLANTFSRALTKKEILKYLDNPKLFEPFHDNTRLLETVRCVG